MKTEAEIKDGKKDGKYTEYYENGNLKIDGNFKNGNESGEFVEYDEYVKQILEYQNGNKILLKEYYPNGALRSEGKYKDNLLDDPVTVYRPDGTRIDIGIFKKNKKVGGWQLFDSENNLVRIRNFDAPTLQWVDTIHSFYSLQTANGDLIQVPKSWTIDSIDEDGSSEFRIINLKDKEDGYVPYISVQYVNLHTDKNSLIFDTIVQLLNATHKGILFNEVYKDTIINGLNNVAYLVSYFSEDSTQFIKHVSILQRRRNKLLILQGVATSLHGQNERYETLFRHVLTTVK